MKLFSASLLGLLTVLSVSSPAVGQPEMQRGRDNMQGRRAGGMPHLLPGRNAPSRDGNGQPSRSDLSPGQSDAEQRVVHDQVPGQGRERLSPEERQQLRRDINAAGRDIYRRAKAE